MDEDTFERQWEKREARITRKVNWHKALIAQGGIRRRIGYLLNALFAAEKYKTRGEWMAYFSEVKAAFLYFIWKQ